MEIKKKIETVEVERFYVNDEVFDTKKKAEQYVEKLTNMLNEEYYEVSIRPDLTEGRGYYDKIIVATPKHSGVNTVYYYLVKQYGLPLSFVQGVSAIPTYIVSEEKTFNSHDDLNKFLNKTHRIGIGDNVKNKVLEIVHVDQNGVRKEGAQ